MPAIKLPFKNPSHAPSNTFITLNTTLNVGVNSLIINDIDLKSALS